MKKFFSIFVLVAVAAMALVSCNKQEVEAPKPQETLYEYTFDIAGDTKATIGDDCVVWESGDKIGVYTDGQNGVSYNRYGNVTLGSPVTFKVSSYYALLVGDMVHCYYPYVGTNSQDPRTVELSIPTSQTEKNQMPMVSLPYAVTEEVDEKTDSEKSAGEIRFANLGSVIEFHVYSTTEAYQTELVKSVTFNAEQAIAGDFTFDLTEVDYSNEETLAISGYEATSVVSTLSTSTQVSADKNAATVVKMVVAPGTYTGNVVVTTDKATYTYAISTAKEFKRSVVQPLGLNLRENVREENTSHEPVEVTATISFANTTQRTSFSTSEQVWENGGVVFTNSKGSSTSNVADYFNPARFYKSSDITITAPGNITRIEFNCTGLDTKYVTPLTELTAPDGTSSTVTYPSLSAQARAYGLTVTYVMGGDNPETPDQPENPEPEVVTLSSIEVSDDAKTEYTVGETFVEPTITATYSDDSTKEIDAEFSGYDMNTAGTYTVNVSYTENGVTVTATYEIVVNAKEATEIVAHTVTWDLSKDETSEATESKIAWDADGVTMYSTRSSSSATAANNYYPGKGYTSTRFYTNNTLTISPKTGYAIKSVVFITTTESYANAFKNSTWTNAVAAVSETTTITLNPEDGRETISALLTGLTGFTKVVVDLVPSEDYVKPVVVLSSIALSGQATNYAVNDPFTFTGTVTATYSNGATKDVTPTQVSSPDMTTAGDKEVTVTYTEDGVSVSATYVITVSSQATVVLKEEFDNSSKSDSSSAISTSTFSNFSGATDKAYKSQYGGIKLGSSKAAGYITSKSLDLSSSFTVQIDACKYSSDGGNIVVTVGTQTKTINNSELGAAGTFKTFTLAFDAATSSSTVKIATSSKRAYIDNVVITRN